jgi:hypothetical protein
MILRPVCASLLCVFLSVLGSRVYGGPSPDTLSVFGHQWSVYNAEDWKVDTSGGTPILELNTPREPLPGPRRPFQFALAQTPDFSRVTVEADMRPRRRSVIIVFAYHDPAHFDYAHLSTDTGTKQPVHNGVFHVFGGERVRISSQEGPAAFPAKDQWYHVVLNYDGTKGEVRVTVDGKPIPALHAVDLSLHSGKVGLGSFDEVGDFKNVTITGEATGS